MIPDSIFSHPTYINHHNGCPNTSQDEGVYYDDIVGAQHDQEGETASVSEERDFNYNMISGSYNSI